MPLAVSNFISNILRRREVRVALLLFVCAAVTSLQAQGSPETLAQAVKTSAQPWIYWTIRLLAGAMAAGGLLTLITAFTGNSEGFEKASKVLGGLALMGIGIYCLSNPDTIYTTLNLDRMFSTTA